MNANSVKNGRFLNVKAIVKQDVERILTLSLPDNLPPYFYRGGGRFDPRNKKSYEKSWNDVKMPQKYT